MLSRLSATPTTRLYHYLNQYLSLDRVASLQMNSKSAWPKMVVLYLNEMMVVQHGIGLTMSVWVLIQSKFIPPCNLFLLACRICSEMTYQRLNESIGILRNSQLNRFHCTVDSSFWYLYSKELCSTLAFSGKHKTRGKSHNLLKTVLRPGASIQQRYEPFGMYFPSLKSLSRKLVELCQQ